MMKFHCLLRENRRLLWRVNPLVLLLPGKSHWENDYIHWMYQINNSILLEFVEVGGGFETVFATSNL